MFSFAPEQEWADFLYQKVDPPLLAGEGRFRSRRIPRMERRKFCRVAGMTALGVAIGTDAFLISGCSDRSPTAPSSPEQLKPQNPPQTPQYELQHPKEISFAHDSSKAERVGEVRFSGLEGERTLREVINAARLSYRTKSYLEGELITEFETVKPSGAYGLLFLIKGDRFTTNIDTAKFGRGEAWAAYDWKGKNSARAVNRVYVFLFGERA
jgi:hypothetical protein